VLLLIFRHTATTMHLPYVCLSVYDVVASYSKS